MRSDCDISLQGWCDSDWAAFPITRRSLSGLLVFLGYSPISWKTKKHHTVSRSSTKAEYRFMASITCGLKWLKTLLLSLGVHHPKVVPLFCDTRFALHIAHNPMFHERTKHIEVDCHFVRDDIRDALILPSYVSISTQLADIFTKALGKSQFDLLLSKLGILDPSPAQLEGGVRKYCIGCILICFLMYRVLCLYDFLFDVLYILV